jgi:hypothetical protein
MATGATLSTLSNILKQFYLPPVADQLNNEVLLFSRLEKSDQELRGNQAVIPLHTQRSGGIGPAGENVALPAAGYQGYAQIVYDIKPQYGRVRVTGLAMEKTEKESGSFLQALSSEVDGIRADLMRDMARQTYGDGTGAIAKCGTTTAANVVVLDSVAGKEALRKGNLYIGMVVDLGTTADARSVATARNITDVNLATPSITIDGAAVTTSATTFVYRSGAGAATTGGTIAAGEINGLRALVSDAAGTVGGINEASAGNSYWANLRDTTTATLTSDALVQNMNQVRIAGGDISVMLGSFGMQRKLFGLLQSQVRYTEPTTIRGGFKVLDFNGHDFIADRDAPFGHIYLLDEKQIKVFRNRDWHFLDQDGHVLKWVSGFDAWEAVLACYLNLGIKRRNTQLVMTNLATDDPNGY